MFIHISIQQTFPKILYSRRRIVNTIRDVNVFIFFEKRSFRYENDDEKSKTIVSIKLVVSLTIDNDEP